MRRAAKHRGFVLVLVLVLLAIAGVLLAKAARRSAQSALTAGQQVQELSQRWGRLSAQRFALSHAESLLVHPADPAMPWRMELPLELNGQSLRLIVSDEQAKANANTLWRSGGAAAVQKALRDLQAGAAAFLPAQLRPTNSTDLASPPFASFDQLWHTPGPSQLVGQPGQVALADRLTFWGDGKINIRRAPAEVLRAALAEALTEEQVVKLVTLRHDTPNLTVDKLVKALAMTQDQARKVRPALTDRSRCHSVWILPAKAEVAGSSLRVRQATSGRAAEIESVLLW